MSNVIQIPQLPAATSLSGSEQLEAVQAGVSVRITTQQIVDLVPPPPLPPNPPTVYPQRAYIYCADGLSEVTDPIVSPGFYQIRDFVQVNGNFAVRLTMAPSTALTVLTIRVDFGINMNTFGIHPADGDNLPLAKTSDPYTYELTTVPFVSNCVFFAGHAYVSKAALIDASTPINALSDFAWKHGPSKLYLPLGGLYILNEIIRLPQQCTVYGQGGQQTAFFMSDYADQLLANGQVSHMIATGIPAITQDLPAQPFSAAIGSNVVTCNCPLHGMGTGDLVTFDHVVQSNGITIKESGDVSPRYAITYVDPNTFTFVATGSALTTHSWGGGSVTINLPARFANVTDLVMQGFTLYGNRAHQKFRTGEHAIDMGSDAHNTFLLRVRGYDVHVYGSAGYGMSGGGENAKTYCFFDRCSFVGSDGDNVDWKNKIDGDDVLQFTNGVFGWNAMETMGTALEPTVDSPTSDNCITTYAGLTTCTLPLTVLPNARAGYIVTISGAATFDGIDPNGSWHVLASSGGNNTVTFDTGQTPTVGGVTGGGTSIVLYCPITSIGDRVIDCRGLRVSVQNCTWTGMAANHNVWEGRGGTINDVNGLGSDRLLIDNVSGIDQTPSWVKGTAGAPRGFVTLLGRQQIATNIQWVTQAGGVGIAIGATADGAKVSHGNLEGCDEAIQNRGDRSDISDITVWDPAVFGLTNFGEEATASIELDPDPFTATVGLHVVTVQCDTTSLTTGNLVTFSGVVNANGIFIRPSNTLPKYAITVTSPTTFTFVASGAALTADPWGGDHVVLNPPPTTHTATGAVFDRIKIRFTTTPSANVIAFANGLNANGDRGQADKAVFVNCHTDTGTNITPFVNYGTNTSLPGGNSGIPNNPVVTTIQTPRLNLNSWVLTEEFTIDPALDLPYLVIGNLGAYTFLRFELIGVTHGSVANQNWYIQTSMDGGVLFVSSNGDYERYGTGAGTDSFVVCGSVPAATPVYATLELTNFANPNVASFAYINGGQESSGTGVQTAHGAMTAAAAYNAVRVVPNGGHMTGGIIRVWRKDGIINAV